jgi:hypothetical protein
MGFFYERLFCGQKRGLVFWRYSVILSIQKIRMSILILVMAVAILPACNQTDQPSTLDVESNVDLAAIAGSLMRCFRPWNNRDREKIRPEGCQAETSN